MKVTSEKKNSEVTSLSINKHTLSVIFPCLWRILGGISRHLWPGPMRTCIFWFPEQNMWRSSSNQAHPSETYTLGDQVYCWGWHRGWLLASTVPEVLQCQVLGGAVATVVFKCPGGGVGGGGGVAIISVSSSGHSELGFVHDFRKFSLKSSSIFLQTLLT